jgi:hypothetical protein
MALHSLFWYQALDVFFIVFHTALIMFNVTGWAFAKLRKYNLITLLLTAFSWFGLGICYGWGYCFCTDWHWQVRHQLGYTDQSDSYIAFLIQKLTGIVLPSAWVDTATVLVFFLSLTASFLFNIRDFKRKKRLRASS